MKLHYSFAILAVLLLMIIQGCSASTDAERAVAGKYQAINDCIFCKIVAGREPSKIIAQNDDVIVFESIRPRYPSHWLIIPKNHIKDLKSVSNVQVELLSKLLKAARDLGNQLKEPKAFNIQINEGASAGQTVFHLHLHFYSQSTLAIDQAKI